MRNPMRTLSRIALVLATVAVSAAPAHAAEGGTLDAVGHTSDGYYWDFSPFGKWELPRLFLVRRDGALGFDAFGSSTAAVTSGLYAIEGEGDNPVAPVASEAEDITVESLGETTEEEVLDGIDAPESAYSAVLVPTGDAEVVIDLSMTRHLVFVFIAIGVLALLLLPVAGKYKRGVGRTSAPQGLLQNTLETVVIYIRDEIARPNLGAKTDRFLPYLLTVFFFILTCNLLGLLPFGATATANLTTTAVLALFTFVITQVAGTKDYWMHILWPPGIPWFVKPILVPIEILGLLTKPFALAVRLFANMTAGHLVLLNLVGLIFIVAGMSETAGWATSVPALGLTLFVYGLEVLVAFIQAYVFTILSALFIGMATAEHEHDHDHAEDHGFSAHDVAVSASNGQALHKEHGRTVGTEAALSPA